MDDGRCSTSGVYCSARDNEHSLNDSTTSLGDVLDYLCVNNKVTLVC